MGESEKTKLQQQIADAKAKHRQNLYEKRLEISRNGFQKLKAGNYAEAAQDFKTYIQILEDYYSCGEGGLDPSFFDKKKDSTELLLISGTYWDLAKLMDRTRSPAKLKDFELYMQKFQLFSKKLPHQKISIDTLEKYLGTNQPFHRKQFEDVHKALGGSKCFVITAHLHEVGVPGLNRYRSFRDDVLKRSRIGRNCVALYYKKGPRLAQTMAIFPAPIRYSIGKMLWMGSFVVQLVRATKLTINAGWSRFFRV